ncbi:MAG: hypothetical protein IJQ95_08155 [Paludibacteraceae bacterium]|nr:hypothetical protein [Paludibacteraceae bacterium]
MDETFAIQLFEGKNIRIVWDPEKEKYYFSVVDIVQVLTDSIDYQAARKYWKVLKGRLKNEGNETVTNCYQLKLPAADGKKRLTDMADMEQILRLIQSIPSKKAEPVKRWLAEVGSQRIDQMIDPELTFQMAVEDYRRQGYSDKWIENRLKSIRTRNELTDEWKRSRVTEQKDFAILTNQRACFRLYPPHRRCRSKRASFGRTRQTITPPRGNCARDTLLRTDRDRPIPDVKPDDIMISQHNLP